MDDEAPPPPPPDDGGSSDESDHEPAPPPTSTTSLQLPPQSLLTKIKAGQDSPLYWEELVEKKNELVRFGRQLEQQLQNLFEYDGDGKGKPKKKPPSTSSISPDRNVKGKQLFQKSAKSPISKGKGLFGKKFKALPSMGGGSSKSSAVRGSNSSNKLSDVASDADADVRDSPGSGPLAPMRAPRSPKKIEKIYDNYSGFVVEHARIRDEGGAARYEKITTALMKIALAQEVLHSEMTFFFTEGKAMVEQVKAMERKFKDYESLHQRYTIKFQKYLSVKTTADKGRQSEVDEKLVKKKKELELQRFDLDASIRLIDAKRESSVLAPLNGLMHSYLEFFTQGYKLLHPLENELKVMSEHVKEGNKYAKKQLSESREEKKENLRDFDKEAEAVKVSSAAASAATGSGIRDLETTQKTSSSTSKTGYLFMPSQHHTQVWVELQGAILDIQPMNGLRPDTRKYPQQFPIHLCTVKEDRTSKLRFAFSVITAQKTVTLQADNHKECMEWISVIQNAIMAGLDGQLSEGSSTGKSPEQQKKLMEQEKEKKAKEKILKDLQRIKGNHICADCDAKDPDWVSLNLGIMICRDCSGVHRALGVHISKVRSIKLDKIDSFLMQYLQTVGNENSNSIWESSLSNNPAHLKMRPTSSSDRGSREAFIRDKYEKKAFVGPNKNKPVAKLNSRLWKAIEDDNSLAMLEALAWGADPNHSNAAEDGRTALHQAVMYRNPILVELLLQHPGTAIDRKEVRGWTPLHYAAYQDDLETVEMILLRGGTRLAKVTDGEGLTPLESASAHNEEALECAKILQEAAEKAAARNR
jgi:Arf-GAP/coiled-coil/ANK repeat/PH domain-containing protein